ncbi:MAG: hypothetical protein O3C34_12660 [Proteobacteria bacterium]|nr:hypothetical protein [Pseudomonadota bacterium]
MAKSGTKKSNRTDFRAEFYRSGASGKKTGAAAARRAQALISKRKVSILVPLFGLLFLLCVIAVAGSSAMIWLRKLGTIFGVEWSGDS